MSVKTESIDEELPKKAKDSITRAAVRAKLLFDTFRWTWGTEGEPPSVAEIEKFYAELSKDSRTWQNENKEEGLTGSGRLWVIYDDNATEDGKGTWSFLVEVSSTREHEKEIIEDLNDPSRRLKVANAPALGGE